MLRVQTGWHPSNVNGRAVPPDVEKLRKLQWGYTPPPVPLQPPTETRPCHILGGPTFIEGYAHFTVKDDENGKTYLVANSRLVLADRALELQLCPECSAEGYFLDEDYLCAACRFALWEEDDE